MPAGAPRGLMRAVATVGALTMASRILGFARDLLIARFLGAGDAADAYVVAQFVPNVFRRLFAEGAFSSAFVPMFARLLAGEGAAAARRFAEDSLAVLLAVLLVVVIGCQLAMDWVIYVIAPGFVAGSEKHALAVVFTTITMPYLLFISLVALGGGVLNSLDRFAAMAATPILLNLTLLVALGFVALGLSEAPGAALSWGWFAAGVVQLAFMLWQSARAGISLRLSVPRRSAHLARLAKLMMPAVVANGVVQINLIVGTMLASTLGTGALAFLYYADRINQLPLGVIGIAISTVLLPRLAFDLRRGDAAAAAEQQCRAVEMALLLSLPSAVGLGVAAWPLIGVLFERGAFTARDTDATAQALTAYAAGLPAFVLVKIWVQGFFAREDTRTPMVIAFACVSANVAISVGLMQWLDHVGLAMGTSLSGWLNAVLLAFALHRRGELAIDARLRRAVPRIVAASALTGGATYGLALACAPWLAGGGVARAAALVAIVAGAAGCYAAAALVLGAGRLSDLKAALRRQRGLPPAPSDPAA